MKKRNLILSFLIPFLIYFLVFLVYGLLTDKVFIMGDSYAQYYPLFYYYKGMLEGNNSIFYSFNKSLGGTMFGTFFYYLSSPLNLLLYFINKDHIYIFMTILTILKLSLCSLTMYIYMSKKFKDNSLIVLLFSICYSLMGYNLNYLVNIMWLDVVILAPLVLLGIDNIINNKSPILYIITLFISIFSNYYIAYMLCIFAVMYFIYEVLLKYNFKKDFKIIKKAFIKFITSSLLSGLMCSFFLIPCIIEMLDYGRSINLSDIFYVDFNIFNLISKTYIGSQGFNDILNSVSLNIYCSTLTLPLVFLYFKNNKISKKEKILSLIIILIFILPCFIKPFDYIFHLFTVPVFYSYRYSFLLTFFLIILAYKSYTNLKFKLTDLLSYLAVYVSYSVIIYFITYFKNYYFFLDYKMIWLTIFFLFLYCIILYKIKNKKTLDITIFSLVILELLINVLIAFNYNDYSTKEYFKNYQKYNEYIQKFNNRMESTIDYNNSFIANYQGINTFLSTSNSNVLIYLKNTELNEEYEAINFYGIDENASYINDALLGIKTIIKKEKDEHYNLLETIYYNDELFVYENEDALNLGYIINNECNLEFSFPYDEKILNCITGKNNNYYEEYIIDNDKKYTINKGYYYIYSPNIYENKKIIEEFKKRFDNNLIAISKDYILVKNNIENYKLEINNLENLNLYYFDYETFKLTIKELKNSQFNYHISKNTLNGTIDTDGGLFIITIPYEKGIKIHINNKLVEIKKVLNTFIGVDLEPGLYDITISYQQPGLKIGIIVSGISFILTMIYVKKSCRKLNN